MKPELRKHKLAFPNASVDGMTLRDYFAAKVLQAIVAGSGGSNAPELDFAYRVADAKFAYRAADAMLEARES